MAQAPPILIYQPGGGVSVPIGSNPPVYTQAGTTVLIEGQDYLDVVFSSIQTDDEWVLAGCIVVNELDVDPLNIWPGIITDKTAAGFRIYFNGLPDSGNYYLHWSVSGINIEPSAATTYTLTGAATVAYGEPVTYTVSLPPSTFITGSVIVTPSEGGLEIGVFSPETVTLTEDSPSATFTFTPALYGSTTIVVNNDRGLTDPSDLALTVTLPTYTLVGPDTGESGSASTDFTVELSGAVSGTVIVTPGDGGDGGTFTPTTVALTTVAPADTFTYTPATAGDKTISVTNDSGLTNPGNLTYTATAPPFSPASVAGLVLWLKSDTLVLSDGDPVSTWEDSSSAGNDATQSSTARPIYKTSIVNSLPVVRFDGSNDFLQLGTAITITSVCNVFVVHQTSGDCCLVGGVTAASNYQTLRVGRSAANVLSYNTPGDGETVGSTLSVARTSWNTAIVRRDGSAVGLFDSGGAAGGGVATSTIEIRAIGALASISALYTTGDIAEVIVYNTGISVSDFNDVHDYLGTKYGITIASFRDALIDRIGTSEQ